MRIQRSTAPTAAGTSERFERCHICPSELSNQTPICCGTVDPAFACFLELPEFDFDATSFEFPANFNPGLNFMEFMPLLPIPPYPDDYPTPNTMVSSYSASTSVYSHSDYDHIEDIFVGASTFPLSVWKG
jgi:hypothetical protein